VNIGLEICTTIWDMKLMMPLSEDMLQKIVIYVLEQCNLTHEGHRGHM
jgi:hypothetical protein